MMNKQFENNGTIRFDLSNIDNIKGVLNGSAYQGHTAVELQYIKQNWDKVKDNVVFYKDGQVVKEPW